MKFDIKKVFHEYGDMWKEFKFEVIYNNQGNCRIHIEGRRTTKYYAGGSGYDKEVTVITEMINDLMGKEVIQESSLSSIIKQFNAIDDCHLEKIFNGKYSNVFSIKFPKKIKDEKKSYKEMLDVFLWIKSNMTYELYLKIMNFYDGEYSKDRYRELISSPLDYIAYHRTENLYNAVLGFIGGSNG